MKMKRLFLMAILFYFPLLLYSSLNMEELCEQVTECVVEVTGTKTKSWFSNHQRCLQCQGFFLNQDGYVLTDKNVVEDTETVEVQWMDSSGYYYTDSATVIAMHPTIDVAILKVDSRSKESAFPSRPLSFEPIPLNSFTFLSYSEMEKNESFPLMGKVLHIFRSDNIHKVMIAIPTCDGGNGTAIFNVSGEIIGIQTASYVKNDFVCCLPIFYLEGSNAKQH